MPGILVTALAISEEGEETPWHASVSPYDPLCSPSVGLGRGKNKRARVTFQRGRWHSADYLLLSCMFCLGRAQSLAGTGGYEAEGGTSFLLSFQMGKKPAMASLLAV